MFNRILTAAALYFGFVLSAMAAPTTVINFNSMVTDTTYLSSGLLLASSGGGYTIGGCGAGSVGCLGNGSPTFAGSLTFRFVDPNTTNQAATDMVSFIMCRGCDGRASSASVYDINDLLLTTINMNVSGPVAAHTFTYSAANIGSVRVDLAIDAVESISFDQVTSINNVPEPGTLALMGIAAAGLMMRRRARRAA